MTLEIQGKFPNVESHSLICDELPTTLKGRGFLFH